MHRYRVLFVILTAVVIATIPMQEVACAAQVTKVNAGRGHVYIDGGKDAGFLMGAQVCFYLFSGEQIVCGIVRQTSSTWAMVKVKNREAKLIKRGMTATLKIPDSE